jgi:hypothetical protein
MRTLAIAWQEYRQDHGTVCPPGWARGDYSWNNLPARALDRVVVPTYLTEFRSTDPWGNPYQFSVQCSPGEPEHFSIRSRGPDGAWAPDLEQPSDYDIVWMDGGFMMNHDWYLANQHP